MTLRWRYVAGGLGFDYPGFVHTVLVDMRARLGCSPPRLNGGRTYEDELHAALDWLQAHQQKSEDRLATILSSSLAAMSAERGATF